MSDNQDVILAEKKSSTLAISSWDDLMKRAEFYAKSALIPIPLRGKPADVAIILQMGMELGLSHMQSLNSIDVIQGKPTLPPQLGLALCRSRLPDFWVEWKELSETKVTVVLHRAKESYQATWDEARAKKLQLTGKENYQKQLGTMLKWRALGEGLRVIASDVLKGCYLEGEVDLGEDSGNSDPSNKDKAARLAGLNKPALKDVLCEVTVEASELQEHAPISQVDVPKTETQAPPEPVATWDEDLGATITGEPVAPKWKDKGEAVKAILDLGKKLNLTASNVTKFARDVLNKSPNDATLDELERVYSELESKGRGK